MEGGGEEGGSLLSVDTRSMVGSEGIDLCGGGGRKGGGLLSVDRRSIVGSEGI